jgi:TatD DNase family protein
MFSDAHTHFTGSPLFPDFGGGPLEPNEIQELLKQARTKGLVLMVVVSHNLSSAERAAEIASTEDDVYAAIGLHPWIAMRIDDNIFGGFVALTEEPKVVAISEIGLDNVRSQATKEVQLQALMQMLRLARETGLPVMLHDKGYHKEMMQLLRAEKTLSGCVHGFEGTIADLKEWLDLGYYVSIGRAVLGVEGEKLKAPIQQIPDDRLLLETDSASRSSEGVLEGQARVIQVAEVVAAWRGTSAQELGEATTKNLRQMLGINT